MPQMTENMAREIIRVAAATNAWEEAGETHTSITAERAFADAAGLIDVARSVYDQRHNTGQPMPPAVTEILFAACVEPLPDGKYNDIYEAKGQQSPATSAPATGPEPGMTDEAIAAVEQEQDGFDINLVYEGYDDQKAKDIVEAIKAGALSGDLMPEEWEQIKSYEAANEERKSILSLEPEFRPKQQPPQQDVSHSAIGQSAPESDYASIEDLQRAYSDGSLGTDRVRQEALPVPPTPAGDEPVLPVDITAVSAQELSRLMMRFHSYESRTLWLVSLEEGRRDACALLRHDAHRAAYSHAFERIKSGLDKQTATALEGARSEANKEADADSSVASWRNREARHAIEARSLKSLSDGYASAAARLSRELTRRTELQQSPTGGRA